MSRAARIMLVIVGGLAILILVGGIAIFITLRRPFPQTDGTINVEGLQGEVHVYRDEYGIPHIYAENEDDLFFAQGYVHAQDRFWQMEFWRHIGQGRVSEITGEAGVESDRFIRTFGWNRIAQEIIDYYEAEAPEFLTILDAYSAGVNAYIDQNRGALATQITVLGLVNEPWEIEPWTPVNSVSWGVVMSDNLSSDWSDEVNRVRLIQALGEATVANLRTGYPYDERPVIAPAEQQRNGLETEEGEEADEALAPAVEWQNVSTNLIGTPLPDGIAFGNGPFVGSNNWVVHGDYTESGLPLLANDPHLGVQMPSIWYEVGLHAPGWNVAGFSFAGVPGVIVGHNEHIAWGVTTSAPDVQDLFIEKINPSNPNQYEVDGEWEEMEIIEEVIKVNGGEDVVLEVRVTRHGPIITEVIGDEDDPEALKDPLAVRWAAQEPSRILQSVVMLNTAEGYEDFFEAMRFWDVPSQSFVYADVEGNIAYFMPGRVPIRANGDGTMPMPGWTGEYEWEDWIPHEDLPALFNPEDGYVVTANNAVAGDDYPYLLTGYMDNDGNRAQRIVNMIEAEIADGGTITADDFARIQFDSHSLAAAAIVPLLEDLSSDDAQVQAALERLRGWDLQERGDSVPAGLFEIFYWKLAYNVLADDVGEENVDRIASNVFMDDLADSPGAQWWDDVTTSGEESSADILLRSLADAVAWFEENVGGDMNGWTWGSVHTITFADGVLGQSGVGLIESMVNRGPFPVDGSYSIVNANSWRWSDPAAVTGHPSMRMIVDMSDLEAGRAIHPTGQSGHPFHEHYDDMIDLWLNGEYHPMRFGQEAVEAAAADHLILQPPE